MNRFVFGATLVVLVPVVSGCSNFYLTQGPKPLATPTPVPTVVPFPFNPEEGTVSKLATGGKGRAMNGPASNGGPTAFRVADTGDIQFGARTPGDSANATLLLVLQPINSGSPVVAASLPSSSSSLPASGSSLPASGSSLPASGSSLPASGSAGTSSAAAPVDASGAFIAGTKDVTSPVRLAGVIVPGPQGTVGGGLQDPDQRALQVQASQLLRNAVERWLGLGRISATSSVASSTGARVGITPLPSPSPIAQTRAARRGTRATATATPVSTVPSLVDSSQLLDVFQDPRYPVDFDNRPLVQIFFKAQGGGQIQPGQSLSLNRMLIRSGLAVVDLYSPTAFDQQTWLIDEAYARNRKLGLWGLRLNGKALSLQQRAPSTSTGTGASSRVTVTSNVPTQPGMPARPGTQPAGPMTSATQAPNTLTPTLAPPAFPRVIKGSGTNVSSSPSTVVKLPPPADATIPVAPASGSSGALGGFPPSGGFPGGGSPGGGSPGGGSPGGGSPGGGSPGGGSPGGRSGG